MYWACIRRVVVDLVHVLHVCVALIDSQYNVIINYNVSLACNASQVP